VPPPYPSVLHPAGFCPRCCRLARLNWVRPSRPNHAWICSRTTMMPFHAERVMLNQSIWVPGTAPQPQVQTNSSRLALTSEQCAIAPVLQQQVATSETITISVLSDRPGKLSQQIRPPIHGTASNRALPCLQIHDMPMMCKVAIASGVV
jgi:hypothetical protein